MSKTIIFIQARGRPGILEAELFEAAIIGELHDALAAAGIPVDAETFIFIDEAEEHLDGQRHEPRHGHLDFEWVRKHPVWQRDLGSECHHPL